MKKIMIAFLLLLVGCAQTPRIEFPTTAITVEVADEPAEHIRGLMHREYLDANSGMIFIFDDEQPRTFWMKDTLIPLDIIFLNKDYEIINIETAVPCKKDPCAWYKSTQPAKYVIEVNAGFAELHEIKSGDKVKSVI